MNIKKSKYDIAVEFLCLILLFGCVIYLFVSWRRIPDQIPGHYNFAGEIDRWGKKSELIILPIISFIMYILMTFIGHFPKIWNTGVTITKENEERVYRIIKNMLQTMKLLVVMVFVYLSINSTMETKLPGFFLPTFIILMFGSLAYFIVKLLKAR